MKIKNKKIKEIYEYILSLLSDGEELLYISGTDKLPEPLSNDEEKEMLDRLASGDDEARKKFGIFYKYKINRQIKKNSRY